MHPAYSVIFFTTASGAGYGLLLWLALAAATSDALRAFWFGIIGLGLALCLIVAGLLSSTLHLGRPERAWRAFSQWRTSWLSREAVLALLTFIPASTLGLAWIAGGNPAGLGVLSAWAAIALVLATIWCTGMIYQSLTTIRAWNDRLVAPGYVLLGLASGMVLYYALLILFGRATSVAAFGTIALLAAAGLVKLEYWRRIDTTPKTLTAGDATGLGRFGAVSVLEQPHTQANYIQREMGYAVARKHALKLRRISLLLAFVLPSAFVLCAAAIGGGLAVFAMVLAVLAMSVGLLTERWLFFAEAQHAVTLFYGADKA